MTNISDISRRKGGHLPHSHLSLRTSTAPAKHNESLCQGFCLQYSGTKTASN